MLRAEGRGHTCYAPAVEEGGALSDTAIRPSVCPRAQLPSAIGLATASRQRCADCGRSSAASRTAIAGGGGKSSRRPRGDNWFPTATCKSGDKLVFRVRVSYHSERRSVTISRQRQLSTTRDGSGIVTCISYRRWTRGTRCPSRVTLHTHRGECSVR